MPKRYQYFGVYSPKSNYLNFIVSIAVPNSVDAFDIVRYLIFSKWDVREVSFEDMINYEARCFYNLNVGVHHFSIGAKCPLIPSTFFIKLARRYLSIAYYW